MKSTVAIVWKTILFQTIIFCFLLFLVWFSQKMYAAIDQVRFPEPVQLGATANLEEKERGKLLIDAITHQMRYELDSSFGWTVNDILFNRFFLDNRASRQYGVYHATRIFVDHYSMYISKLGTNDRENEFLYDARLNYFPISPRSFLFPSAEGRYKKGLKAIEKYKASLDDGSGVYNFRTDDSYSSLNLIVGENMLGYALGLLENSHTQPFYKLDNRIYEAQGIALVVRDFLYTMYELYPDIKEKNNEENMREAMRYLNLVATYDPLYITSKLNCGELVISYILFAKNRIEDIRDSIRM